MTKFFRQSITSLSDMWSLTDFRRVELSDYAKKLMFVDASTHTQVTLSIGIMQINCQQTISLEQIYSKADEMLYKAKGKKQDTPEATIEIKSVR